ncbi:S8 family serine peptidase [Streptomyces sp. NPDC051636]|uniref:S8 family serine peptidase n=1 Tax=Streptomyces sp. NPDC051636 TaxID=3365663 RepID=UPI00378BC113
MRHGIRPDSGRKTWAQSTLALPRIHQLSKGAGVKMVVVDAGVALQAPALPGRVSAAGAAGSDGVGHGTFAAGLLAAVRTQGSDGVGMAAQARVTAFKSTDDRSAPSPQQAAGGIREAADRRADVIYVGYALRTGAAELTQAATCAARGGARVVAPVAPDAVPPGEPGPEAQRPTGPYWPAAAPGVLSVVDFAPSGPGQKDAPPAHALHLSAPGGAMVGIGPRGWGHYIGSGASLTAGCTAGAAALVRAHHPHGTAKEVSWHLLEAAYPADTPRLDRYAAMTMTLPHGTAARAAAPPAHMPALAEPAPGVRAWAVAGGSLALVLPAAAAAVIPRGRARVRPPPGRPPDAAAPGQ